ncbi:hypothetical protein CLV28_0683 [Sediminihabitans luteus]|uniref:Excisionase family DNA binding protein n=1 Tax=Sediminihabitans luteus TaxID=1138585 RepID=A0A2M9CZU1_9CELL|nr:helix-turn-helix domain-containing protein [Sediminihabitans luteus]PJJ77464.1 hypothetical protein CLV28_0683 [Sediminihabitans luteus]GII98358.1 hypothetical protein Slu03_07360 [Sediminihabitans luteus]
MSVPTIAPVSFDYAGAAAATGCSRDVIQRAVRAGDLPAHYPKIAGRAIAKPLIDADDLRAWVRAGDAEKSKTNP